MQLLERMHWTYDQLLDTPKPLLDALACIVEAENEYEQYKKDHPTTE